MKRLMVFGLLVFSMSFTNAATLNIYKDKDGNTLLTNSDLQDGKSHTFVNDDGTVEDLSKYNTKVKTTTYSDSPLNDVVTTKSTAKKKITKEDAKLSTCEIFSSSAEAIMDARQSGVAMSKMINIYNNGDFTPNQKNIFKRMIINAFEVPRFELEENQYKKVIDFRDEYYLACTKAFMKQKPL